MVTPNAPAPATAADDGQARREPHVVVLGAGFAGLNFVKSFRGDKLGARITLIDRTNHHVFQPLLYQVAMAGLSAADIAEPIRTIFRYRRDVTALMDGVRGIDLAAREVKLTELSVRYDYLVVAMGGLTSYFGHNEWAEHAPGLKTIEDALEVRRRILTSFERAESTGDMSERQKLMTIVVVGGGPTGVELAGSIAELCHQVFKSDFKRIDTRHSQILLLDGGDRVLGMYPQKLSAAAQRQLEELGVKVRLNERVVNVTADGVHLKTGEFIPTYNVLWGGGVVAHPITASMGVPLGAGGRIKVEKDLSIPGHPEAFAIGDLAAVMNDDGTPVPGVAPAAIQMGQHVAKLLTEELKAGGGAKRGAALPGAGAGARPAFKYRDKGSMATIGRNRAVAWVGRWQFSGFTAWLAWLLIHVMFLVGFRDKVSVMMEWAWAYLTYSRGARIVFGGIPQAGPPAPPPPTAGATAAAPPSASTASPERDRAAVRSNAREGETGYLAGQEEEVVLQTRGDSSQ